MASLIKARYLKASYFDLAKVDLKTFNFSVTDFNRIHRYGNDFAILFPDRRIMVIKDVKVFFEMAIEEDNYEETFSSLACIF